MRFGASSALVPLVVTQSTSPAADEWLGEDANVAVWRLAGVELASAVMRLRREGRIEDGQANEAESRIDEIPRSSHVIIDVDAVESQARRLLRLHPLRAADALQLGAAEERSRGLVSATGAG